MDKDEVIQSHIGRAGALLTEALHFHRFFGHRIDNFTPHYNEQRAASNDRLVRGLAREAGMYAAFATNIAVSHKRFVPAFGVVASKALEIERIVAAYNEGYAEYVEVVS